MGCLYAYGIGKIPIRVRDGTITRKHAFARVTIGHFLKGNPSRGFDLLIRNLSGYSADTSTTALPNLAPPPLRLEMKGLALCAYPCNARLPQIRAGVGGGR